MSEKTDLEYGGNDTDRLIDGEGATRPEKEAQKTENWLWWVAMGALSLAIIKILINGVNLVITLSNPYLLTMGYGIWNMPAWFLATAVGIAVAFYFEPQWMLGSARNFALIVAYCIIVAVILGEAGWMANLGTGNQQCIASGYVATTNPTTPHLMGDLSALCSKATNGLYGTLVWFIIAGSVQLFLTVAILGLLILIHNNITPLRKLLAWIYTNTKQILKTKSITSNIAHNRHKNYTTMSENDIMDHVKGNGGKHN